MRQAFSRVAVGPTFITKLFLSFALAAVLALSAATGASANSKYAAIVIDAKTGKTLFARYADSPRFPASLTKMMTLYMVFEALENGHISKKSRITISKNAAAEPPSKLGLKPGSTITVNDAILTLATKSANDISTAVAEYLGGSEAKFAAMMTQKARALGMKSTNFRNAHGLPDSRQTTTARDMARLGIALREHFPQYYGYFSTRVATVAGKRLGNHNRLLGRVKGMDGIKTGYTRASGFNLVSSVEASGRSIVAVVMGGRTANSRNQHMVELISAYMPRASRRGRGDLIAEPRTVSPTRPVVASAGRIELPNKGAPTPDARPVNSIEREEVDEVVVAAAPAPQPYPAARADEPVEVAVAEGDVDMVETASTVPSGWVVQVASLLSEAEARSFLDRTSREAGGILANATPFTEKFDNKGTVYWRARYAGFGSKNAARGACNALKKRDISCYAVQQ
ncbi:MAG: D-alanyl-D-alanine carboxypeptidase [Rhizobiaceae bacterium]|nr:D-alanyl-D-alanine carboxypeptidase [Rhizobiaceae bacterium]